MNIAETITNCPTYQRADVRDPSLEGDIRTGCPVCGHSGVIIGSLRPGFIRQRLECYFDETAPPDLDIHAYDMRRCPGCLLEYADPMMPGTSRFYDWIVKCAGYYPNRRWEYGVVRDEVSKGGHVLDVGCGDGVFLEMAQRLENVTAIGLDTSERAVKACRRKGLTACADSLETLVREKLKGDRPFDYAVSFHCLEHARNPLEFARLMASAVKPGGKIFLSTPYSPMSFEYSWFDVLNHPPHHLTRWNVSSYSSLATRLGMNIRFHMPGAAPAWRRALFAVASACNATGKTKGTLESLLVASRHPAHLARELSRQIGREKVDGRIAANVILAELFVE